MTKLFVLFFVSGLGLFGQSTTSVEVISGSQRETVAVPQATDQKFDPDTYTQEMRQKYQEALGLAPKTGVQKPAADPCPAPPARKKVAKPTTPNPPRPIVQQAAVLPNLPLWLQYAALAFLLILSWIVAYLLGRVNAIQPIVIQNQPPAPPAVPLH